MDFIEQLFGFSPDGGSGAFELTLIALPIAGLAYFVLRRYQRAHGRRPARGAVTA